jgi:hypothetical protein
MAQQQQDSVVEDNIGWENSSDEDDDGQSSTRATAETTNRDSQNSEQAPPTQRPGMLMISMQKSASSRKVSNPGSQQFKQQSKYLKSSRNLVIINEEEEEEEEENSLSGSLRFLQSACVAYDTAHDKVHQFRHLCGYLINAPNVQLFMVSLIMINAMMMGIATFDWVRENPNIDDAFEICDTVFLVIFTIELGMQFAFFGFGILLDGWLVFDLIIITLSWSFSSVQIIRAFRIFRAFRLITRVKVLKNLVSGMFWFLVSRLIVSFCCAL